MNEPIDPPGGDRSPALDSRIERLYRRLTHGIKPGLDTTFALLDALGRPERELAVVHVAGTNGKGSVCALIAAGLRSTGLSVGLYTSPHLRQLNERFQLDGQAIGDAAMETLLEEIEDAAARVEAARGVAPTFFECTTAAALLHFQRQGARLAVLETGMGGRLDATNVVCPLLAVITRIGLDHREHLGPTIERIAVEKAGIIKPNRPVVVGAMPAAARAVVARTAERQGAPLVDATECVTAERVGGDLDGQRVRIATTARDYGILPTALAASYQVENIATAVAALEALGTHAGLSLPEDAVATGLATARWPGRFQRIGANPPVLVDGAHNPDGARALLKALRAVGQTRSFALVCGFCEDKDVEGFFRVFASLRPHVWTVPVPNPRSMHPETVAARARAHRLTAEPRTDLAEALREARDWAAGQSALVLVCGSLFLVGAALDLDPLPPGWNAD